MHLSSSVRLYWVSFTAFFFLTLAPPSVSDPIFSPKLSLVGDASFRNNSIILTREFSCLSPPTIPPSAGRAFYAYPFQFLDSTTNSTVSFSCRFSFTITPSPSCTFGDGIAFLIISNAVSLSSSEGYMGLPNPQDSQDLFFAVEFDTSSDSNLADINGNHVGIDVNTLVSAASIDAVSRGIDLKSGKEITAWIEYRDPDKMIRVWVGYSQTTKPQIPILVSQIDLSRHSKEFMHVGFSASNGKGSASHTVNQWWFKTFKGLFSSAMPMDAAEKGDCLFCFPGEFSPQDQSPGFHQRNKRGFKSALGFGGLAAFTVSVVVILVIGCVYVIRKNKRQSKGRTNEGQIFNEVEGIKLPKRMSLAEIRLATRGFKRERIIGEGASATVYEGSLRSCGGTVAVKRFNQARQNLWSRNPFANEFGTMVGCLRHKNLVQLQGWCCDRGELVLVYEFMPNGSLDRFLHSRTSSSSAFKFLTWDRRLKIVLGVASALIYLHEECERQIIHRDVKTCNIMLDAEFNAKLGDFGLAEVYEHSRRTRDATLPAGTMGYLAPEYVYSGIPTVKTDVYSFGVVVLEVASGRRPVENDGTLITDWVWDLWEKGLLIEAADTKLLMGGRFNKVEIIRLLMVGLSCVYPNHEKRPIMKEAAGMLRGEVLPILPLKKPRVKIRSVLPDGYEEDLLKFRDDLDDGTPWSTPRTHFSSKN